MKKAIFFTAKTTVSILSLLFLVSCLVISGCSKDEDMEAIEDSCHEDGVQEIFTVVEQMPRFPGCEDMGLSNDELYDCASDKMLEFVYDNLEYPIEAFINDIEGTVVIRFSVDTDGSVCNPKTLKTLDYGTAEEAIRVIRLMPDFIPGRQRGEPVKVYRNLPVRFEK